MSDPDPASSPSDSINVLFGMLAKAFDLEADDLAQALESGALSLDFCEDHDRGRYVSAVLRRDGTTKTARLYRDAVYRESGAPSDGAS